jgi:hypothetical protein
MEWVLYCRCDSGGGFAEAGRGVTFWGEYDIGRKRKSGAIYYEVAIRRECYWSTILIRF